jgi:hypothetical protein
MQDLFKKPAFIMRNRQEPPLLPYMQYPKLSKGKAKKLRVLIKFPALTFLQLSKKEEHPALSGVCERKQNY